MNKDDHLPEDPLRSLKAFINAEEIEEQGGINTFNIDLSEGDNAESS